MTSDEQSKTAAAGQRNAKARGYRDLLVWQKGMRLVRRVYDVTGTFPAEEKFGLMSQMRRCAVSIPSNIAEGQARKSTAEFVQFISHAEGSAAELDTQMQLGVDLGYLKLPRAAEIFEDITEIKRMLNGLRRTLLAKG